MTTSFLSRSERLTREQFSAWFSAFVGWVFDYYEVFLLTFLIVPISAEFGLSAGQSALIFSIQLLFLAVGGVIFGFLADHWGDSVALSERGGLLISNPEIARYSEARGARVKPMGIGGTHAFEGGWLKFFPAWHSSSLPDSTYGGTAMGVVVQMCGTRIYHAGDTGLFADMRLVGDLGIDLAILPMGDNFTMGPEDALRALELIQPRRVLPRSLQHLPAHTARRRSLRGPGQGARDSGRDTRTGRESEPRVGGRNERVSGGARAIDDAGLAVRTLFTRERKVYR